VGDGSRGVSRLATANGSSLRVEGTLKDVDLIFGDDVVTTDLVITPDVPHSLIIGHDILKQLHAEVDLHKDELKLPQSTLKMFDKDERLKSVLQGATAVKAGRKKAVVKPTVKFKASTAKDERRGSDATSF
jgi:hypothetical protein